jgi:hypothetical protein
MNSSASRAATTQNQQQTQTIRAYEVGPRRASGFYDYVRTYEFVFQRVPLNQNAVVRMASSGKTPVLTARATGKIW